MWLSHALPAVHHLRTGKSLGTKDDIGMFALNLAMHTHSERDRLVAGWRIDAVDAHTCAIQNNRRSF
jgi:hypothetical protein